MQIPGSGRLETNPPVPRQCQQRAQVPWRHRNAPALEHCPLLGRRRANSSPASIFCSRTPPHRPHPVARRSGWRSRTTRTAAAGAVGSRVPRDQPRQQRAAHDRQSRRSDWQLRSRSVRPTGAVKQQPLQCRVDKAEGHDFLVARAASVRITSSSPISAVASGRGTIHITGARSSIYPAANAHHSSISRVRSRYRSATRVVVRSAALVRAARPCKRAQAQLDVGGGDALSEQTLQLRLAASPADSRQLVRQFGDRDRPGDPPAIASNSRVASASARPAAPVTPRSNAGGIGLQAVATRATGLLPA